MKGKRKSLELICNPSFRRLRQEKQGQSGYIANPMPAWTTVCDPAKKETVVGAEGGEGNRVPADGAVGS